MRPNDAVDRGSNFGQLATRYRRAANEIANKAFIDDRISFNRISEIIEESMNKIAFSTDSSLESYLLTDKETRKFAESLL